MDDEKPSNALLIDGLEERLQLIKELEEYWGKEFEGFTRRLIDQYEPFGPMQVASLMV